MARAASVRARMLSSIRRTSAWSAMGPSRAPSPPEAASVRPCRRASAWSSAIWQAASAAPTPCAATVRRALFIMVNMAARPRWGSPISQAVAPS